MMDHEYSISGTVDGFEETFSTPFLHNFVFRGCNFTLSEVNGSPLRLKIEPKDKGCAASFSDEDVVDLCRELSISIQAHVRLEKLHEEYGLLNVFNGGSDYEVVSMDCLVCEFDRGQLVLREKRSG